jgi:hypothetical protein
VPRFKFADGQEYAPGVYEFGPFILTNNIDKMTLTMPRAEETSPNTWESLWPDTGALLFNLRSWVSLDEGQTWQEEAGMGAHGGLATDPRDGSVIENAQITWSIPSQKQGRKARRLKIQVEVFSTFSFEGHVTWQ